MSEDAEQESEEEVEGEDEPRMGCLARMIPVTTPGCASLLTAVFLVTTVITVWLVFWLDPDNVPWRHAYSVWRILGIVALAILLPYVVYKTISLWLEGAPKAFPELDHAWRAGLHALATHELSIDSVPVFLITGSSGESQEKAIMSASGLRFSVEGVPQGPAPIHWYANSEAIYLFCSDCSWTSALASLREELAQEAVLNMESPLGSSMSEIAAAPAPTAFPQPTPSPQPASSGIRGTLELDQFVQPTSASSRPRPTQSGPVPASADLRGTLMFSDSDALSSPEQLGAQSNPSQAYPTQAFPAQGYTSAQGSSASREYKSQLLPSEFDAKRKPVLLSHQYSGTCLQELQYLGQLVRRARQPVCTINGVLALIQIESIHSTPVELEELHKALRGDMETIRQAFRMRSPRHRAGSWTGERARLSRTGASRRPRAHLGQRFGKRFDVQALPTKEEMMGLGVHICGVFEDWAYALFREEQALMHPATRDCTSCYPKCVATGRRVLATFFRADLAVSPVGKRTRNRCS